MKQGLLEKVKAANCDERDQEEVERAFARYWGVEEETEGQRRDGITRTYVALPIRTGNLSETKCLPLLDPATKETLHFSASGVFLGHVVSQ